MICSVKVNCSKRNSKTGNAYRVNNLEIVNKKLILCVHDGAFTNFCQSLEDAFSGQYPFGYIGTSPWLGVDVGYTHFLKNDFSNLKINKILLDQGDFALIFYCFKSELSQVTEITEYFNFMKINMPSAKHIVVNIKGNNEVACKIGKQQGFDVREYIEIKQSKELVKYAKQYIDNAGKPKFYDKLDREAAEWANISFDKAQDSNKKRILLVGDSISYGYGEMVRRKLPNMEIDFLNTSEGTAHPIICKLLEFMLTQYNYDAIHINIGIHIHSVTNKEYEDNLNQILEYINKISPKTKIIFATTTSVSKKSSRDTDDSDNTAMLIDRFNLGDRVPCAKPSEYSQDFCDYDSVNSQRYIELNEIVKKICVNKSITIDDLFAVSYKYNPIKTDVVHFKEEGYMLLSDSVVDSILLMSVQCY